MQRIALHKGTGKEAQMRYKNLLIILSMLVVFCLIFTACGPVPAPVTDVRSSTTEPLVSDNWNGSYDKVPPELCPPDKESVGQLKFDTPAQKLYEGKQAWVQHGLFANEQGELFRMNAISIDADTVNKYTYDVKVCLDKILTSEVTAGKPSEPGSGLLPEEFGVNPNDLIIEVYLVGMFDPQKISGDDVIYLLLKYSAQEWGGILKEMGLTPEQAGPEELKQDYVVDFVIDPNIENGSTHFYPQRSAMKAYAVVSVADGAGAVEAQLYRDLKSVDMEKVNRDGGPVSAELDYDNEGIRATFNLTVTGNPSGRYQLSGRAGYDAERASWVYGNESDPPPCASTDICLELVRGKSVTGPISMTTSETPIPKVDVLLLFDVTSSMGDEIDEVKKNASYIMETVKEKVDAAFGVGSFADYPYHYDYAGYVADYGAPSDYPWSLDLDITTDTGTVQSTLDALGIGSGGDEPECYSRALSESANISWRADTKMIIVLFGDSVAHDYEFFPAAFGVNTGVDPGSDNQAGTGDDLAFGKVVEDLRDRGIEVIPISGIPDFDARVVANFFDYLAKETGGQVFTLATATEAPEAVVRGLEAATARINKLTISTDPYFSPWVTAVPSVYYDVGGGESRSFEVTITVPEAIEPRLYEFDLIVLGDNAILQVYHVALNVPQ